MDDLDIRFAYPHALWISAAVNIGLRHVPDANRELSALAKLVAEQPHVYHDLNMRVLRARQLLSNGRALEALPYVESSPSRRCVASMRAEYYSTRAMVFAALGDDAAHEKAAHIALAVSRVPDARAQVAVSFAIAAARRGDRQALERAFAAGERIDAWDPFICALRGDARLAEAAAESSRIEPMLRSLLERSGDVRLARKLGVKLAYRPQRTSVLSERETEILGLLAQGMRNDEIARTLYIAPSTVKVHIHHILEKLGVRTRAQAVACLS